MKRIVQTALLIPMILSVSACAVYKLEELRHAEPVGTPFQKAQAMDYKEFSLAEEREYDWWSAVHFAEKSLTAAYGRDVEPESLADWEIAGDALKPLEKAREDVIRVVTDDVKSVRPQLAADAIYYFDCWVEQQEEGWQLEDIARCRDAFYRTIEELSTPEPQAKPEAKPIKPAQPVKKAKPLKPAKPPEAKPAVKPEKPAVKNEGGPYMAEPAEMASYIVFFDPDRAVLTPAGGAIVDNAARLLESSKTYRIVINARGDNSLSATYDPTLPAARAETIKNRLLAHGIKESAIDILAEGGTKSAATMPAETSPAVSRRVEIFITE